MDFSKKKFHIASYVNLGQLISRLKKLLRKVHTRSCLHWMARSLTNNSKDVSSSNESHSNVFGIEPHILASIVPKRLKLSKFGGIQGIARCLHVRLDKGVCYFEHPTIKVRKHCYGSNRYHENSNMSFWMFVWKQLRARAISLIISVLVYMCFEASNDGWPKGRSVFLVIIFTAVAIYIHYLLFRNLTAEKKIEVLITRAGNRERVSKYDLVVGDIVHLCIGDQVPADGLFIQGRKLLIEESSLTGGSELVNINSKTPHLLSGSVVKEGFGKMLVTSVGKNTEWGRMMGSVSEWREDETPLPTLLNDVAINVGWICLVLSILAMYLKVVPIGVPLASMLNLALMKERL